LIDLGADTVKGIGRGILPGLFKTTMVSAPSSVGIVAPRATYRVGTNAQRLADYDPDRSMRLTGNGMLWDPIFVRSTDDGVFTPIASVNPYPKWRGISPLSVDPRAFELAKTFQFYAFRLLRFTYIPATGSSGDLASRNIAFGISQDAQEFVDLPDPNLVQMLEQNKSVLTPAWTPCTLSYEHDGTRTWRVDPTGQGTIDEMVQCLLGGVTNRRAASGEPVSIGNFYMEYILDLYEPQPVEEAGDYTVALPYVLDGNDNITGTAVYDGSQYPSNYNSQLPHTPPNIPSPFPPLEEEKGLALLPQSLPSALTFIRSKKGTVDLGLRLSLLEKRLLAMSSRPQSVDDVKPPPVASDSDSSVLRQLA